MSESDGSRDVQPAADGEHPPQRFVLQLFVAGTTPRSLAAVESLKHLCDEHLAGRYELRVIDIYRLPEMAEVGQVIAAPTLVKELPLPLRRIVGDMLDESRVLLALGLREEP